MLPFLLQTQGTAPVWKTERLGAVLCFSPICPMRSDNVAKDLDTDVQSL